MAKLLPWRVSWSQMLYWPTLLVTVLKGSSDTWQWTQPARSPFPVHPGPAFRLPGLLSLCYLTVSGSYLIIFWFSLLVLVYFFFLASLFLALFNLNFLIKKQNKTNIRLSNFALANILCQGTDPEHLPEDIFITFGFIIDPKVHGIGCLFPRIWFLVVYLKTR